MPVKWTPENDQLLLLKILETHDISVDYHKVMNAWPKKEGQDIPTARAISERLTKIKNLAKTGKGTAATPKGTPTKATPRKRAAGKTTTPGSKRSRTKVVDDSPPDTVKDEPAVKNESNVAIKQEGDSNGIVKDQTLEDVFAGGKRDESSVSEYAPADVDATPAMPTENGANGGMAEYA